MSSEQRRRCVCCQREIVPEHEQHHPTCPALRRWREWVRKPFVGRATGQVYGGPVGADDQCTDRGRSEC
jgi:hypothetical protein